MLKRLILEIAPKNFDPGMLHNTELYIIFLATLFLCMSLWITGRAFARWIGIAWCRFLIRRTLKKAENLKSVRSTIESKIKRHTSWAFDGYKNFHLAWEEARLPQEDKAVLPIRLREFLTAEMVLDGVRNRRIAEALPGIFVALGIFGTFLGLVLGLGGIEFGKLENLQNGVGHLISGLSLAFLTSLAGIALSIAFSISYRFTINRLERSFLALDDLFCQVFPFESQERYARRYFQTQEDVKQGLQTLATDVATQITGTIAPQLGEALEKHLVPVMKDLHGWIEKHIEENKNQQDNLVEGFNDRITRLSKVITEHFKNSQDRQSEAMEAVLQHYSVQLTETFQNQFEAMGHVIEQTTQAQLEIKEQLADFGEQLKKQFQSQGELIEKTNRAGEVLSSSLESLESIAKKLKSSADDITSAAELLEQSANSAKDGQEVLRETMERQIETMARTRQELEDTWRQVTDNAGNLVDQISHTVEEFTSGVGENLVKALDSFDGKIAEVVERFSGTLFEAGNTIADMPQFVLGMNESLNAISSGINDQKDILSEIRETSKNVVAENIQMAFDASKELQKSADGIGATAISMNEFFDSFVARMTDSAESFDQRNRQALNSMSRMIDELVVEMRQSQSLLDTSGPLGKILQRIEDGSYNPETVDYNGIETSIAKPIAALCSQVEELVNQIGNNGNKELDKELVEKIIEIDQKMKVISPGLKHIISRLANMDSSVTKMSAVFDSLKSEQDKSDAAPAKKWGFFGLGNKS